MKDIKTLSILQYNVRNDQVKTMIPLLADPRTQNYDIIAVQEPWRNPNVPTTLNSYQSGFHLLYRPGGDTRVCFYVNANINPSSWDVEYPSADICTLTITVHTGITAKTINIHNIYNPSPTSYTSTNSPSTIPTAAQQLRKNGEHILLGDFNLHHLFWSGPFRPTVHAVADQLLDLIREYDLSLTLPRGTVTWETRNTYSTIDLVFISESLAERLEHCKSRPKMDQSSDHILISTKLQLTSEILPEVKRRAFKLLDMDKLKELEKHAPLLFLLHSTRDIDDYTTQVQGYLQQIIEETVT